MTREGYPPFAQPIGSVAIASAATTSSSLDLTVAGFTRLAVTYATFSTGAVLTVQGSVDNSTFKTVHTLVPTSSVAQHQPLIIATAVSATGYAVFAAPPFRYVRFLSDTAPDNGGVITVYGAS